MDKNTIIGIVLIGLILVGYTIYNKPSEEELQKIKAKQDSIALVNQQIKEQQKIDSTKKEFNVDTLASANNTNIELANDTNKVDSTISNANLGIFSKFTGKENKIYTVENKKLKIKFSSNGGKIYSVQLKNYHTYDSLPLMLFDGDSSVFSFNFFDSNNKLINTENLQFTPESEISESVIGKKQVIKFKLSLDENKYIEHIYTIYQDSFAVDFSINYKGLVKEISPTQTYITLTWNNKIPLHEKGAQNENNYTTAYYKYYMDDVDYISERSDGDESVKTKLSWIAFKDQFFSSVLISKDYFINANIKTKKIYELEPNYIKSMSADIAIPFTPNRDNNINLAFYFGPNKFNTLKNYSKVKYNDKDVNLSLEKLVPLGWTIFGWVNRFIVIPIFNFLNNYISSFGIIILLLTLIIKAALFPLTYKSYKSSAKMRVLKPQIDEINKKYSKDKAMEKQKETMALYKRAGVNPMGGCLPMLLQMPILFALFRFFPTAIELRQQSFLWADDLSSYDSILHLPFNIPMYGDHVSLFTLLMTASTLVYTKMQNQMNASSTSLPGMKTMMYIMPVMFLFFLNNYSSGLSYYYFIANVITFSQMYFIKRTINEQDILKKLETNSKKPIKKSKFQQRLEYAAKQRQLQKKKR